mmetsp:Transcript_29948/g.88842  ORF Transcript_29948/g.88842 Transcript_29948/m.88842 type:complete len:86 (+) Transcript_29948:205-462(+)
MCNPTACTFCALMSIFGAIMMFIVGILVSHNYPYLGEWYEPEEGHELPTDAQIATASTNCFTVMGIYMGFTVLALCCVCLQRVRR